mgnify:CR=1 FL=1
MPVASNYCFLYYYASFPTGNDVYATFGVVLVHFLNDRSKVTLHGVLNC